MIPAGERVAHPWNLWAEDRLPAFTPHPFLPGEYLNYYRLRPVGVLVPIPAPLESPDIDTEGSRL